MKGFEGERVVQLKYVPGITDENGKSPFAVRPSYKKVWEWTKYGVKGVRLVKRREGRLVFTSVEAVERFLEATQ